MDNHAEGDRVRTVFFDDECELCEGAVKKIEADIDLNTVGMSEDLPRFIDREALKRDVHAMDENGVMHKGIDAIIVILRWHPQGRFVASVLALPGIKQVGAVVYRIVASNRHRWFGKKM
ncbi:MAG: DUF393 domain-containing protein [Candidatus Pacebacteria bacterium]|nr:DUF393 domain-containing protein [Candidatus Paceibacterota bacterium]